MILQSVEVGMQLNGSVCAYIYMIFGTLQQ